MDAASNNSSSGDGDGAGLCSVGPLQIICSPEGDCLLPQQQQELMKKSEEHFASSSINSSTSCACGKVYVYKSESDDWKLLTLNLPCRCTVSSTTAKFSPPWCRTVLFKNDLFFLRSRRKHECICYDRKRRLYVVVNVKVMRCRKRRQSSLLSCDGDGLGNYGGVKSRSTTSLISRTYLPT